ncbi:uncharacterized protein [Paralichthys olivaceus]|uniref:uncharacterized protein n=1 Tax=Paralichthys olivaceus TaxID=8255 RepID=UPI00375311AD
MREMFQYLLLGHLLIAGVVSQCVPVHKCLKCNITEVARADSCQSCPNTSCIQDAEYENISSNCKRAFSVSINSSRSDVEEGDDINLTCMHNFVNLTLKIGWKHNGKNITQRGQNRATLFLKKVFQPNEGKYICYVKSRCGIHESLPYDVTIKNNSVILLIVCGTLALVLFLTLGLLLKYKLKRDNARHRERREMRAQGERS